MRILLPLLFLPLWGWTQRNAPLDRIDSFLQAEVLYRQFNGNVLIANKGKVVYQKSFGYRHLDPELPLDSLSVFEVASISKQFTAGAILQLAEQGKLTLNDSLRKYFPSLPYGVTIRQMLTHTSGLPHYEDLMEEKWDWKKVANNDSVIRYLALYKPPMEFPAGRDWSYNNTAYVLLASIVERVSRMSYDQYMMKNVFSRLGMNHTRIFNTRRWKGDTIANYAYGYVWSDSLERYLLPDSLPEYRRVYYLDAIVGDAGVNSTAGDLFIWVQSLKNHSLLKEKSIQLMTSPLVVQDTSAKRNYYYGLGQFVTHNELGKRVYHSGSWPGYKNNLAWYPERDLVVIVLCNNNFWADGLAASLENILAGRMPVMPEPLTETEEVDDRLLSAYAGVYEYRFEGFRDRLTLTKKDGRLVMDPRRGGRWTLRATGQNQFCYDVGQDLKLVFVVNVDGEVVHGDVYWVGVRADLRRIN